MRSWSPRYLLWLAGIVVIYVVTARLGYVIHAAGGFAALVWPPSGISLAALLLLGHWMAPGVWLGAFLTNMSIGVPPLAASFVATGNTLAALLGAALFQRATGSRCTLERLGDVVALILLVAPVSAAVSATVGILSLVSGGVILSSEIALTWGAWWVANIIGDLVVAAAILTWSSASSLRASPARIAEAAVLGIFILGVGVLLFGAPKDHALETFRHSYVLFPVLTWAAVRFGPRGAATANLTLSAAAIWGTMRGLGPFAHGPSGEHLVTLQIFIASVSATVLMLGAAVNERNAVAQALRAVHDELESTVLRRTAELRQRQIQLAEAQRIGHLGSWDWDVVRDEIAWSDELYRIHGLSPQEFRATFKGFMERIHPDDQAYVRSAISEACFSQQAFSYEKRIVRPDGTIRWLLSFVNVIADAEGRTVHMVGTCQDITDLRRADEARFRLAAIVESSEDAIIGVSPDGVIESWNLAAEHLFSHSSEEVVGQSIGVLRPFSQAAQLLDLVGRVACGGTVQGLVTTVRRKDGSDLDVWATVSPIRDSGGRSVGASVFVRDITIMIVAEKQLRSSLMEKDVLLREFHHRVKNNLQVISSLLNLQSRQIAEPHVQDLFKESESRVRSIALAHENIYRAKDLGNIDFQDYLVALTTGLLGAFGRSSAIKVEVEARDVRLCVDLAILCGLIVNELVSNALKHAFPGVRGGKVVVRLRAEGEKWVRLEVGDDGEGFPETLDFRKAPSLGLQLVCNLTDQLRGTIELQRRSGTWFSIRFPAAHPAA